MTLVDVMPWSDAVALLPITEEPELCTEPAKTSSTSSIAW